MKTKIIRLLIKTSVSALLLFAAMPGRPSLPEDISRWARSSIKNTFQSEFKKAIEAAEKIIKKYPDHPAGYFFYAAVLETRMEYFQNKKDENEFYRYCDIAIDKGEDILETDPEDCWALFFVAGANGEKGTYESMHNKWVTAFRHGWRAVVSFKDLKEKYPDFYDVLFGIGTYDYWRSEMTKTLWWMPGVKDKRQEAIKKLYTTIEKGVYVKDAASLKLLPILINEERYKEAAALARKMLKVYPGNLMFKWELARACIEIKEYDKAEVIYKDILMEVTSREEFKHSRYYETLCYYYLAKIKAAEKKKAEVALYVKKMKSVNLSEDTYNRIEVFFKKAEDLPK